MKSKYDADKSKLENKILDTCGVVKKTDYSSKISNLEIKIPDVGGLATKSALTAVENKIPDILVKRTNYNSKPNEPEKKLTDNNHDKYITTPEFNKPTAENFAAWLKQANLVTKTNFDVKLGNLN